MKWKKKILSGSLDGGRKTLCGSERKAMKKHSEFQRSQGAGYKDECIPAREY